MVFSLKTIEHSESFIKRTRINSRISIKNHNIIYELKLKLTLVVGRMEFPHKKNNFIYLRDKEACE